MEDSICSSLFTYASILLLAKAEALASQDLSPLAMSKQLSKMISRATIKPNEAPSTNKLGLPHHLAAPYILPPGRNQMVPLQLLFKSLP